MLQQELIKRDLLPLLTMKDGNKCTQNLWGKRREELLDILQENIYGYTPKAPERVMGEIVETNKSSTTDNKNKV